jgi:hypothetical protein
VTSRLRRIPAPLALILAVAAVEALTWILVIPALQGPDEVSHFTYVQRLVEKRSIPMKRHTVANPPNVSPYSTEVAVAQFQAGLGPLQANPAARPYWTKPDAAEWSAHAAALTKADREDGGYASSFKNPPLYYLYAAVPYAVAHGASFFDRELLIRLANVPLLLISLVFVWLVAGELLGRGRPQIAATATAALLPQLLNVTATINPDVLLIAEWSAALYVIVLVVRRGPRRGLIAWLAALCLLGALTHARSLPLFAAAALAVAVAVARERGWRHATPLRLTLGAGALYVVAAVVVAGWGAHDNTRQFVSYVWQFYLPRLGFMTPKLGPPHYGFRQGIVDRLYGTLAQLEVVLPHSIESIVHWLSLIALVALVAALIRRRAGVRANADLAIVLVFTVFALVLGVHVGAYRGLVDEPSDPVFTARYLLPLLPLFGAATAIIVGALPRRAGAVVLGSIFAIGVALQLESIGLLVERFYA